MCNLTFISERTGLLIVAFMGEKKKSNDANKCPPVVH